MKCDFCDSKATVFLTQLVEGQMKKICLCEACAKEQGVTDPTGFSLADFLSKFDGAMSGALHMTKEKSKQAMKCCPECGFTMEDLRRVRRFGCGNCYQIFADELNPMLGGMHKGVTHKGKVPEGLMMSRTRKRRIDELKNLLEQAIFTENYENAASLRDELNSLNQQAI